ncbi:MULTISPECIES: HEPN domain-containing protein [Halorussus]|uniref:HEPN domain-containing protein n=1 Tax=Halorussus TaxID=1070314 RepID=UPI000E211A7D|nr:MULTISPECIES: HEPN domain-containing protein [Halorussus]NHN61614.1 HEPN domain-containing protein [Halorussus sp. JP-T4]
MPDGEPRDGDSRDSDDCPGGPTVERELGQARQALPDADAGRDAGLSDAAVVNRLYYATFHAVQAALYDRGCEPTSHGGVLSLFGTEIVATGDAPRERGRFLYELSEFRQQADYGYGTIDEDVGEFLRRTRRFVSEKESLCDSTE